MNVKKVFQYIGGHLACTFDDRTVPFAARKKGACKTNESQMFHSYATNSVSVSFVQK